MSASLTCKADPNRVVTMAAGTTDCSSLVPCTQPIGFATCPQNCTAMVAMYCPTNIGTSCGTSNGVFSGSCYCANGRTISINMYTTNCANGSVVSCDGTSGSPTASPTAKPSSAAQVLTTTALLMTVFVAIVQIMF
eukprot:TRINITY_DN87_c0_g1_i2.p1 TRINITY_DN87_c0_g1~~TRINITY_DN87_c0_g1_i2.p1  ORF type:complete len:136 (-),score=51.36 TRINITY_DN87_c0_g1_i2:83-490(-)